MHFLQYTRCVIEDIEFYFFFQFLCFVGQLILDFDMKVFINVSEVLKIKEYQSKFIILKIKEILQNRFNILFGEKIYINFMHIAQ